MTTNTNQTPVRKMADGARLAVFLSLATNIFEAYGFITDPGGLRKGISIAVGIVGTILIWQFSRELQAEKKQALFYWLALGIIGYSRWIFIDGTFSWTFVSAVLVLVLVLVTMRLVIWTRNKTLA
jgi:hypothetical protein